MMIMIMMRIIIITDDSRQKYREKQEKLRTA